MFNLMVKQIRQKSKHKKGKKKRGPPYKLRPEDQLLLTLMYWREYRTMYHIAHAYGISEAAVCRTIQRTENRLSKSKKFKLPGKKQLTRSNIHYEVIVVDTTESPIERPKKNSIGITRGKRNDIP